MFLKAKFKEYDLKLVEIPVAASLRQIAKNSDNYFYIEFPNGKRLFHNAVNIEKRFPIHIARYIVFFCFVNTVFIIYLFGDREVLASPKLLNVQDRIDWRKCEQTIQEEEYGVEMFRNAFAPYNPIKD